MRGLFGRRSHLTEADKARLEEAEEVVAEFEATLDSVINIARQWRADGEHDQTLFRLSAHRLNWKVQIRKNMKAAIKAFEDGEREQAGEYLRRAVTKASQGMDDLDGRVVEILDEEVRPPPGSAEAASWVSIGDPRLRMPRDVPVGSCLNETSAPTVATTAF
jgi:hypothetical protein